MSKLESQTTPTGYEKVQLYGETELPCDSCQERKFSPNIEAFEEFDVIVCDECAEAMFENKAELAWERQQAANLECPPVTMKEQYEQAWKEKQGLK